MLISLRANANSITTIFLVPNDGSGDNFGFYQQSPTRAIEVHGGIPFDVFNAFGYAPGSNLGGTTDVFFDNGSIVIGGISHDLAFQNGPGTLFISSFTLPTNGSGFSTLVTLTFSAVATTVDSDQPVFIFGSATGTATFSFFDENYYAQRIKATSTVPEPGAFGLVGTGVLSILAAFRKKLTV